MKRRPWVPERGEIVWISFDPAAGHEQAGRRPALVLSPSAYNGPTGRALLCPLTTRRRCHPFETVVPDGLPVEGVVLVDHVKSLDWRARRAQPICRLPADIIAEALARLAALIDPGDTGAQIPNSARVRT